ncbi:Hint domain-containing protein [Oligoflexaceae bacterium]|nr:Hint domain-containing protein [Oligoflexaceae bacterium]
MKIKLNHLFTFLVGALLLTASSAFAVQLTLAQFKALTKNNSGRCNGSVAKTDCHEEIAYAVQQKLIDSATGEWARKSNYFPTYVKRGTKIGGVCQCGCFAAGTKLLTGSGWQSVAAFKKGSLVTSFDHQSKLSRPEYSERVVKSAINGPEKAALYTFVTESGQRISVTQHHGMVLANGRMKAAKDIEVGERFVTVDGEGVKVVQIKRVKTSDPVYNIEVTADFKGDHIIAADGLLVGDLVWQNSMKKELGSIQLRR